MKYLIQMSDADDTRAVLQSDTFDQALYYLNLIAKFRKATGWSTKLDDEAGTLSMKHEEINKQCIYQILEVA